MLSVVEKYFLLFFVLSIIGWCLEVTCKFVQFGRFINRGFLIGPYCPIYGVGSVLIILLLSRYADDPIIVFLMAMFVCGTLEYLTSYAMEKIFHARWWDYSNKRFNINGRVCANTLVPFGVLGLALIYGIYPFLFNAFNRIPPMFMHILCGTLLLVLLTDTVISATVLGKIRSSATHTSDADDTETLTHLVRERLSEQGTLVRRALKAFPYVRIYNSRILKQMLEKQEQMKREAKEKTRKLREDFEAYERSFRDKHNSSSKS